MSSELLSLSDQLANVAESAGKSIVRVDDGTRLTASGIVWEPDVIVATSHGVERDEDLSVVGGDGRRLGATLIGRDSDTDIAVLRLEGARLPALESAAPREIRRGQLVLALGRPGEAGLQVTLGVVGGLVPTIAGNGERFLVQTDAVFYPGFSGGALVDVRGRLIGLNNLWFGRGRAVSVGVAVVAQTVEAILAHGRVPRAYLGVRTQPAELSDTLRQRLGLEVETALLVVHVEEGSPAEQGGLLIGDLILEVDERPTQEGDDIRRALRDYRPGQPVAVRVIRGGAIVEVTAALGSRG